MKKFAPYPTCSPATEVWLGEVPSHWKLKPLWSLFKRVKRTGYPDEPLLSVYRDYGVIPKDSRDDNHNRASEDLSAYQLVEPGDLAINKMKAWQGSVAISDHQGIVSPAYFIFKTSHKEDPRYLHYLMRSDRYISGYLSMSKGIRVNQWDLDPDKHARMPVVLPPLAEQKQISHFLETETASIDTLIAKKTLFIDLLKEKRQAVITKAVTKGLDDSVEMKDSGEEWIGRIPASWVSCRIKDVAESIIGLTYSPNDIVTDESGTPVLRSSNIQDSDLDMNDLVRVKAAIPSRLHVKNGDILVCARNGSRALIGKNIQIDDRAAGCAFGAFMTVVRSKYSAFLYYIFNSSMFDAQSGLFMTSTVNQLTISMINNMKIAIPPEDEQAMIVERLRNTTKRIDNLIQRTQRSLELLKEKRSTLITAAVTGKIDVREAA